VDDGVPAVTQDPRGQMPDLLVVLDDHHGVAARVRLRI
jgi:hypothetical protein